ncbi:MAG: hypothetical protein JWL69_4459 [Phycisphaerales bacterium]|nr:hypothetical protein [Phycisphaerales bacterium]
MKVLLVSEGKHELAGALETLARRLVPRPFDCDLKNIRDPLLHTHPGKGPGYFKKALRCVRYAHEQGYDAIVLVIDQDDDVDRRRHLTDAQNHTEVTTLARALGVAVRTFDAWMLADEQALSKVLGKTIHRLPDPETTRDAKQVCINLRGAPGGTAGLAEMYGEIAVHVNLTVLEQRCPTGFGTFADRVRTLPI